MQEIDALRAALIRLGVPLRVELLPQELWKYKATYPMTPHYITLHNAAYAGPVENLVSYMKNCCLDPTLQNLKSWHLSVGESVIVLSLPLNRSAWHAGDGNGAGNRQSIGIESTRDLLKPDPGGLYKKVELNMIKLAAALLYVFKLPLSRQVWHQTWMPGKPCPHRIILEGRQKEVRTKIGAYLNFLNGQKTEKPTKPEKPAVPSKPKSPQKREVYRVQIGSFPDMESAERYAGLAKKAGFNTYIWKVKV